MRRSARIAVASLVALTALAGCSREKIDWKSAEAADTVESYDHFIERHPDSALATQARTRVAQLNEDRDWKKATGADTADAYRQFLSQHESGKWAEEARIRVENFSLDGTATGPAKPAVDAVVAAPATAPARASKEEQAPPPAAAPARVAAAADSAAAAKPATPPRSAATTQPTASKPVAANATVAAPSAQPAANATRVAAAPGSKPAAPTATPPPSDSFGIQLGAFRSQDAALKNWKQLQVKFAPDLHGLFAHAVPVKQGAGQLFRLQAPVGDEARARAICASLAKQSQPCVVVLPVPK